MQQHALSLSLTPRAIAIDQNGQATRYRPCHFVVQLGGRTGITVRHMVPLEIMQIHGP